MAKRIDAPPSTLSIEREGKVTTWTLYKRPVTGTRSEQEAYERGYRAFISDFNQGKTDTPTTVEFRKPTDALAYEQGYLDAKNGGVTIDGRTHAPNPTTRRADNRAFKGGNAGGGKRTAAAQARRDVTGGEATRPRKRATR